MKKVIALFLFSIFCCKSICLAADIEECIDKLAMHIEEEWQKEERSLEELRQVSIGNRLLCDLHTLIYKGISLPGDFYEGENWLANVVAIAEKQERILDAIAYMQSQDVDPKVESYFFSTLEKLRSGINVPLPDYFHATKSGLESIIRSGTIVQSPDGHTGRGVYISNNNEGDYGYGSHTFAIDEGCLVDTKALFRTGRHPITNVFFSLWAAVRRDLPVQESTIAFIDTSLDDVSYVKALLAEQGLEIQVLDRSTAEAVLRIFDLTTQRRELPSFSWKKFCSYDYLPQNTYPRTTFGSNRWFRFVLD